MAATTDAGQQPGAASFEVERFDWSAPDRLELTGRWFGVRGLRFMRPTLELHGDPDRRALALLDHKPWAAEDGQEWVAEFPWDGEQEEFTAAELSVAPSVVVELPPPGTRADDGTPPAAKGNGNGRARARAKRPATEALSALQAGELRRAREERDAAVAERDKAVAERTNAVAARDHAITEREAAIAEREAAIAERDAAIAARDKALAERVNAATARDQATADRDRALSERHAATTARDHATAERDALAAARDAAIRERDEIAAERDRAISERGAAESARAAMAEELNAAARERDAARNERDTAKAAIVADPPGPTLGRTARRPPAGTASWVPRAIAGGALGLIVVLFIAFISPLL